jgi:hypothetical protein
MQLDEFCREGGFAGISSFSGEANIFFWNLPFLRHHSR